MLKRDAEFEAAREPPLCALPYALAQAFAISRFDKLLRTYRIESEPRSQAAG